MTVERTEDAGLAGVLDVTMGGGPVRLRALTYDESEVWLERYADALSSTETTDGDTDEARMRSLVTAATRTALDLVLAYDIDGVLGGADAVRARASRREIAAALELMVTVEDPLSETAPRLAALVFGLPSQIALERVEAAINEPVLRLVRSLSTRSAPGASTGATSGDAGPRSSSSSTGRTRRTGTAGTSTSAAS